MSILNELQDFIGETIVAREIEHKGNSRTFHFRELTAHDTEELFLNPAVKNSTNKGLRAKIIAKIVCRPDGSAMFTKEEADTLPNSLATNLQEVCIDINGLNQKDEEAEKNA